MKKRLRINTWLFVAAGLVISLASFVAEKLEFQKKNAETEAAIVHPFHDGDIIFQTSHSGQSQAIQEATHSKYTHCGLLFNDNGNWMVYEAVGPVRKYPFESWIQMGDSSYYIVRRLAKADSIMTPATVAAMRSSCNKRMGIGYDYWFGWDDSLIYCSELVWKAYNESTGLHVGEPKPMKEYDLTQPLVVQTMNKRYGKNIPYDELMISPGDIFDSPMLTTVTAGIR